MFFIHFVAGKPLATSEERAEHIGPISGIPVFGLDALSSAAYGPEAALTLLIPLGAAGIAHIVPISFAIIALLAVVFFSYCQTIDGYPHGVVAIPSPAKMSAKPPVFLPRPHS
jgi:hypothetical protein